jgi:hypothetical protein
VATLFGWALVPWIAWFDRHRVVTEAAGARAEPAG